MDMIAIKKVAFELMEDKNSHSWKERGNKYYHGERVASLALKLRKLIFPEDDSHDDILTVAAWFHDIMNGNEQHAVLGAERTREVLADYCSKDELEAICEIISVHDDRYTGRDRYSNYIKLHQDADHLDHFGTYDIWMTFLYAIPHEQKLSDTVDFLVNTRPTQDEKYRNELNFDISKVIYDEKSDFVKYFSERFQVEANGGIWDELSILNNTKL
jgi:uncharacterized protein